MLAPIILASLSKALRVFSPTILSTTFISSTLFFSTSAARSDVVCCVPLSLAEKGRSDSSRCAPKGVSSVASSGTSGAFIFSFVCSFIFSFSSSLISSEFSSSVFTSDSGAVSVCCSDSALFSSANAALSAAFFCSSRMFSA